MKKRKAKRPAKPKYRPGTDQDGCLRCGQDWSVAVAREQCAYKDQCPIIHAANRHRRKP